MQYGNEKRPTGWKVDPLSTHKIRGTSTSSRRFLVDRFSFIEDGYRIDALKLFERVIEDIGFPFSVEHERYMGSNLALTDVSKRTVKIRQDIYDGAKSIYSGLARFTLIHELGHIVLHSNQAPSFSRTKSNHEWYEDSEWQADTFSGEFLMPVNLVQSLCSCPNDIVKVFGVSQSAAYVRWDKLKREGLI
uniref:IrrE N-terminal-like domain-containing protein n=3 Tax=Candidatus Kentrum sp. TC TaxID=2126339 RepID=A0A451AH64_9GAMM|nr:MAG: protein of unknown function (DUF955) [Candidatus Kentron sp. TC]